jgi:hypothetical protein
MWLWNWIKRLPGHLDWLVSVAERLIVLGLSFAPFWLVYRLLSGKASLAEKEFISKSGENWKPLLLLLLIPLFYKTLRKLIEELEASPWFKRRRQPGLPEEQEETRVERVKERSTEEQ